MTSIKPPASSAANSRNLYSFSNNSVLLSTFSLDWMVGLFIGGHQVIHDVISCRDISSKSVNSTHSLTLKIIINSSHTSSQPSSLIWTWRDVTCWLICFINSFILSLFNLLFPFLMQHEFVCLIVFIFNEESLLTSIQLNK